MESLKQMQINTICTEAAFERDKDRRVKRLLKNNHITQAIPIRNPDTGQVKYVTTNKVLHLHVPTNTPLCRDPTIRWVEPMWPTAIHSLALNRLFNEYYRTTFSHSDRIKYIAHWIHADIVDNKTITTPDKLVVSPNTFGETNPLQLPSGVNDRYRYADCYSMYDLRWWEINVYRDNQLCKELRWVKDQFKWMDIDNSIKFLYLINSWINRWSTKVSYKHYWKNKDFPIYNEILFNKHDRYIGPETLVYYYNYDVYSQYLLQSD